MVLLGEENTDTCHLFLSYFNSIPFDYLARQKIGGTDVGYYHINQLPFPKPSDFTSTDDAFIRPRVLELAYTSWELESFARELGWSGSPFFWDEHRRYYMQRELDTYYAIFLGLSRDEWKFVLDPHLVYGTDFPGETFRVLKEKEIALFGDFRTMHVCLDIYDAMQRAMDTGEPYRTALDPPPADPRVAHPESTRPDWAPPLPPLEPSHEDPL